MNLLTSAAAQWSPNSRGTGLEVEDDGWHGAIHDSAHSKEP